MRIGLICNTHASLPLLNWLHSQQVLKAIGTANNNKDFKDDLTVLSSQINTPLVVFQKDNLKSQLSVWLSDKGIDLVLVLAFPYKIPKKVLDLPKFGFYNFHFGKLPKYGGSFPVFWQIKNGEKEAALTIHQMDDSFDTGPIAFEIPIPLNPEFSLGTLEMNFSFVAINGAFLLIDSILKNNLKLKKQLNKKAKYYPKPNLKDLIINWQNQNATQVVALVKACNPWNKGAYARVEGFDLRILEAKVSENTSLKPGEIISIFNDGIRVGCKDNSSILVRIIFCSFGYLDAENMGVLGLKQGVVFEKINI